MGLYMTVVLKREYRTNEYIEKLNYYLYNHLFASGDHPLFNSWKYLQGEANYFNFDKDGLKEMTHFPRPITKKFLSDNFFWFRHGQYCEKISGEPDTLALLDILAVCKWISQTNGEFIDKNKSKNYDKKTIKNYLFHQYKLIGMSDKANWNF